MLHRHHRAREGQRKVSPSGPTPMSSDQIGKLQMAGWQIPPMLLQNGIFILVFILIFLSNSKLSERP